MVLAELGDRLVQAIGKLNSSRICNTKVIDECIKEISNALVSGDISIKLVIQLRKKIKERLGSISGTGVNTRKIAQKEIYSCLVDMLSSKSQPFTPVRNKTSVVLLVGLQGAGKTTTASKLAYYYKRNGFRVAMVCADTYRAGAYAQLKQNASKIKIPFYGSATAIDAAKIASEGVKCFKNDKYDIILVDTSGRHKNEKDLFKEMKDIETHTKPDHCIFVIDGTIGQSAIDQATYFKNSVKLGSAIVTKLDGNSKGGGALSAIHSADIPVIFVGKGEGMTDLERFDANNFVKRLLGLGDLEFLMKEMGEKEGGQEVEKAMENVVKSGKITFNVLKMQLDFMQNMGSFSYMMEMIPGFNQLLKGTNANEKSEHVVKNAMVVMSSLNKKEMESDGTNITSARKLKIAYGCGKGVKGVDNLIALIKPFKKLLRGGMFKKLMNMNMGENEMPDINSIMKMMGGMKMGGGRGKRFR